MTDAYVEDIEKAILLSKIDFEEHKATMKVIKEEEAKLALLESSKKPKTMSLDQFHQLDNNNSKESELNTIFIHQNETNLPSFTGCRHSFDKLKKVSNRFLKIVTLVKFFINKRPLSY